ncbi:MAG: DJ-1/PfpI family protein [Candidatus Pacebacteria bacterium]|nr:DJ-1/PfpI family protein [Candidatus Paceibacterota bacterium]
MKKIIMIIAFRDFKDEEYFIPKQLFKKSGFIVKTASSEKGTAIGSEGGETKIDLLLEEIKDFDALVLVGGQGCLKYLDNEKVYQLIQSAHLQEKLIAGICIAPVILAKAGILKQKQATVWNSSLDKSAIKILKENGAIFEQEFSVVQDNNIITAPGPSAVKDFAQAIINNL